MLKREELTTERIEQIVRDARQAGFDFFLDAGQREADDAEVDARKTQRRREQQRQHDACDARQRQREKHRKGRFLHQDRRGEGAYAVERHVAERHVAREARGDVEGRRHRYPQHEIEVEGNVEAEQRYRRKVDQQHASHQGGKSEVDAVG